MSDLHSVKASDSETLTETETYLNTYRVLRQDDTENGLWREMPWITMKYVPLPAEIGEAYGEGNYLLIERDSRYSFLSTYEMRVVADKRYRLADEDA
jgi:hypothetical protein